MSKAASKLRETEMNRTSVALVLLTTVLAIVQTSLAEVDCTLIRIKCKSFQPYECRDNGGIFVLNGGLCGYCDACVKYVGVGANCSIQAEVPRPTPTCRPHLTCGPEGFCRHPKPVKPPVVETCPGVCTMEYNPVCGTDGNVTLAFANKCQYDFYLRCETKNSDEWKIVPNSQCQKLSSTEPPKKDFSEDDCPGICTDNYSPVCGSDGNTTIEFENTCTYQSHLRCKVKNSKEWKVVAKSECRKIKPEEDLEKPHGDQSCPGVCTLELNPVCGSDGVTTTAFANRCQYDFHLRCQVNNSKEWKLISNRDCPDLNRNDAGVDHLGGTCPGLCNLEYKPVCGSDGNIYMSFANKCRYDYHLRCQVNNSRDWQVISTSVCQDPPKSNVSGNNSANSCPGLCTLEYNAVCGSDGNTRKEFANLCQYDYYLRCEVKNPKEWKLLPNSACLKPAPSNDSKTNSSDSCPGLCSLEKSPVCGSDGNSTIFFANLCLYESHVRCIVKNPLEWKLLPKTTCQNPSSNQVEIVDIRVEVSISEPCPGICSLGYVPVCGSDGSTTRTFKNKCHYDHHLRCIVNNKNEWKLLSNSTCEKPESVEDRIKNSTVEQPTEENCPGTCSLEYSPICGSDGNINVGFGNKCHYDFHLRCKVENPKEWRIVPNVDCLKPVSNGSQEHNSNYAQSTGEKCPGLCTMEYNPLCGSDGNSTIKFPNRCQYDTHLRCFVKNAQNWKILPNSECTKGTSTEAPKINLSNISPGSKIQRQVNRLR